MVYAVVADIHGNLAALEACVSDAKAKGAEGFWLLGDYIRDTPYHNEVIDLIRGLPNSAAILGNGDQGVLALDETKPDSCAYEQMYPNFWAYRHLSATNLRYLQSLKETADITLASGQTVHLSHSMGLIAHTPRLGAFHSGDYARRMEAAPFTPEEGMQAMQNAAEAYAHEVAGYAGDICLFGHNHLPFLGRVSGKILCNPGSCGQPLDYDTRAPYALLTDEGGAIDIALHRVLYDRGATIAAMRAMADIPQLAFWGKLCAKLLQTGSDSAMGRFWKHANGISGGAFPMPNDQWRRAVETFPMDEEPV
jgi:predicted phosphodiesterase